MEFAIDPGAFHDAFAADLPAAADRRDGRHPATVAELAFTEPNGAPAWKTLPVLGGGGHRRQGGRHRRHPRHGRAGGATITEVEGSHVIMISQPQAVTDVILTAIAAVS